MSQPGSAARFPRCGRTRDALTSLLWGVDGGGDTPRPVDLQVNIDSVSLIAARDYVRVL